MKTIEAAMTSLLNRKLKLLNIASLVSKSIFWYRLPYVALKAGSFSFSKFLFKKNRKTNGQTMRDTMSKELTMDSTILELESVSTY